MAAHLPVRSDYPGQRRGNRAPALLTAADDGEAGSDDGGDEASASHGVPLNSKTESPNPRPGAGGRAIVVPFATRWFPQQTDGWHADPGTGMPDFRQFVCRLKDYRRAVTNMGDCGAAFVRVRRAARVVLRRMTRGVRRNVS